MVRQVRPAVVRIQTTSGTGSGVIFETDGQTGYVITNYHVVEGKGEVDVIVSDTATYRGTVLGVDSVRDLAVVRICCGSFRKLAFGNASDLDPGAEVINIGYAMGLQGPATITKGIVSAVRYDSRREAWVIQTDAPINPGNSGGPMLSPDGKVLGINTFKISETSVEGLGFAISQTTVQGRIPVLRAGTPEATPTPVAKPTPTPEYSWGDGFGAMVGELRHDPSDGLIEAEFANVNLSDFIVTATLINPYSAASNDWDYGFGIRRRDDGRSMYLVVMSDRRWRLGWRESRNGDSQWIANGRLTRFDTSSGGRNTLWVLAVGQRGLLFVNNEFVSMLDLSAHTGAGDISVITGYFKGGEVAGAVTRFEDFGGASLGHDYGPATGDLERESKFISEHDSGVWARDLVTEATFTSPPGKSWDYGFIVRNPELDRLEVIVVTGDNRWFHETRDLGDDEYTVVAKGDLSASLGSKNHLLLFAFEDSGFLFVNGELVSRLDLAHNLEHGGVSAIGGFFSDHTGEPSFENFNVWTP